MMKLQLSLEMMFGMLVSLTLAAFLLHYFVAAHSLIAGTQRYLLKLASMVMH